MKIVSGIVLGFLSFWLPIMLMFFISGQKARDSASMRFMIVSTALGILFAAAGGFVATRVSGRWISSLVLGLIVVLGALSSFSARPPAGRWSLWATLIMSPAFLLGGRFEKNH